MRVEVVIVGENARANELLLKRCHEIEEIFGPTAADVVDLAWRDRETVVAASPIRSSLHDSRDRFDRVVAVCKIALTVSKVVDLHRFSARKSLRRFEIEHVRTTGGPVDRKETQARRRDIEEFSVRMRKEFVRFLRRSVQRDRCQRDPDAEGVPLFPVDYEGA